MLSTLTDSRRGLTDLVLSLLGTTCRSCSSLSLLTSCRSSRCRRSRRNRSGMKGGSTGASCRSISSGSSEETSKSKLGSTIWSGLLNSTLILSGLESPAVVCADCAGSCRSSSRLNLFGPSSGWCVDSSHSSDMLNKQSILCGAVSSKCTGSETGARLLRFLLPEPCSSLRCCRLSLLTVVPVCSRRAAWPWSGDKGEKHSSSLPWPLLLASRLASLLWAPSPERVNWKLLDSFVLFRLNE